MKYLGLYLYLLVVETFSNFLEVINKFIIYAAIGYGIPAICALSWSVVKIIVAEREGMHETVSQVILFWIKYFPRI